MPQSWLSRFMEHFKQLFPLRYKRDGATWWSWHGRQYLYREAK